MRIFLLTISVILLMTHNIVPHHHDNEILLDHHHDFGHSDDQDDEDNHEGLAYVLANVKHNPASEKIVHQSTTGKVKVSKTKVGNDLPSLPEYFYPGISEHPPDLPWLLTFSNVFSSFIDLSLLRAPPVA